MTPKNGGHCDCTPIMTVLARYDPCSRLPQINTHPHIPILLAGHLWFTHSKPEHDFLSKFCHVHSSLL